MGSDTVTNRYLHELNQRLRKGTSAHITADGRLFYQNIRNKSVSWLPPIDSWSLADTGLPYGWEVARDGEGKLYYINHLNKTTTYEDPRRGCDDEPPPMPREVKLTRDAHYGFGFVVGSEKPVIIRYVQDGGPSVDKLLAGDQILRVNGEDVSRAPRDKVIESIKTCHTLSLTVCQPDYNNSKLRKSALLTAAKKAKLRSHPSRVRFAEGVGINGSPMYSPSPYETNHPFIANVFKVFLEYGHTKTFKYDSSTTVQDVLDSLIEKLSIKCGFHFSLCTEHIKSMRRSKMTLLNPNDKLASIAARPGAHNLRCLFRMTFVPNDVSELLVKDPVAFDYLYVQCCNDVVQERLAPELKYDTALRLAALHLHQHALANGLFRGNGKVNLKAIEKQFDLESFVPYSLLESMKRKELRGLLNRFLKQNFQLCPPGQKYLTAVQTRTHYLQIISELPCYGAKLFSTNIRDSSVESALLISPKYGISHVSRGLMRQSAPITLAKIEEVTAIKVIKDDEQCFTVEIQLRGSGKSIETSPLHFGLDEKDTEEFVLVLRGYHRILCANLNPDVYKELPVFWNVGKSWWYDSAPSYHGQHLVVAAPWSYLTPFDLNDVRLVDLSISPPLEFMANFYNVYSSNNNRSVQLEANQSSAQIVSSNAVSNVDHNMNNTILERERQLAANATAVAASVESASKNHVENRTLSGDDKHSEFLVRHKIVIEPGTFGDRRVNGIGDDEEPPPSPGPLKAADSLLLLTQIDKEERKIDNEQKSASESGESDTDGESYTLDHRSLILVDAENSTTKDLNHDKTVDEGPTSFKSVKIDVNSSNNASAFKWSSNSCSPKITIPVTAEPVVPIDTTVSTPPASIFRIQSPEVYGNLSDTERDLIEALKNSERDTFSPYHESPFCLDHDIIDLTVLPPPPTPSSGVESLWNAAGGVIHPLSSATTSTAITVDEPPTPYREDFDVNTYLRSASTSSTGCRHDDDVYGTLGAFKSSSSSSGSNSTTTRSFHSHQHGLDELDSSCSHARIDYEALELLPKDIDDFIAFVSIPPPPSSSDSSGKFDEIDKLFAKNSLDNSYLSSYDNCCDDISSLIIPPPPPAPQLTLMKNSVNNGNVKK